jgi:hypothetical protein
MHRARNQNVVTETLKTNPGRSGTVRTWPVRKAGLVAGGGGPRFYLSYLHVRSGRSPVAQMSRTPLNPYPRPLQPFELGESAYRVTRQTSVVAASVNGKFEHNLNDTLRSSGPVLNCKLTSMHAPTYGPTVPGQFYRICLGSLAVGGAG